MTAPTVASIVPVYNRQRIAIEALQSIADQTRRPDLLIVVDDGSTDQTAATIQQWADRRARGIEFRLVQQSNQGPGAARNRGLAVCGDVGLIAFLDSDDLWPPNYLQRMMDRMAEVSDAVAASCDWQKMDFSGKRNERVRLSDIAESTAEKFFLDHRPKLSGTVIRTDSIKAVGGFDPCKRNGEVQQLLLRLSLHGRWVYVPGEPVAYRQGPYADDIEPQACRKDSQRLLVRAEVSDTFVTHEGGNRVIRSNVWRPRLARMWYRAGRQAVTVGEKDAARRCFRRASELKPFHAKTRWWRLRLGLGV